MNILTVSIRLTALSLPPLLAGASCGPLSLICADDEDAVDTNGDGFVDSCVIDVCPVPRACNVGETEVAGPQDCLQDEGAVCYGNSVCGSDLWCTGPAIEPCFDDDDCGGDQTCDLVNFCECDADEFGNVCEADCTGRCIAICPSIPFNCPADEPEIDVDGDGCTDTCEPLYLCDAYPVCSEGHAQIQNESECEEGSNRTCYRLTTCGVTILCTGDDAFLDG